MADYLTDSSKTNPSTKLGDETLDNPHFDSKLIVSGRNATTNADLILTLKIQFIAARPGFIKTRNDAAGTAFPITEWTAADNFSAWCKNACRVAEETWNGKLWLKTPYGFNGLDYTENSVTYRPNIHCGFRCVEASSPSEAHCRVTVARIDEQRAKEQGLGQYASNFVTWSYRDTWKLGAGANYEGGIIKQTTACHEVGHLLGLHHIGEVKSVKGCFLANSLPWSGANACYGSDDPNPSHSNNIMGMGMEVTSANALPWQTEMCKYANELKGWYLTPERWAASSSRVAPQPVVQVTTFPGAMKSHPKEPSPSPMRRGSM